MKPAGATKLFISTDALLEHWLGHRRLTRRVIEALPEDQLFTFSIGGMRTFGEIAQELLSVGAPLVQGLVTGEWVYEKPDVSSKEELLRRWDESTAAIQEAWSKIPEERFQETVTSFGAYTGAGHWQVLYVLDNEIHHRGQGYVYLRALGVEPPPFYERG